MVEIYNLKTNQWSDLSVKDAKNEIWSEVSFGAGMVQMNEKDLLIFGGESKDQATYETWVISLTKNGEKIVGKATRLTNRFFFSL